MDFIVKISMHFVDHRIYSLTGLRPLVPAIISRRNLAVRKPQWKLLTQFQLYLFNFPIEACDVFSNRVLLFTFKGQPKGIVRDCIAMEVCGPRR